MSSDPIEVLRCAAGDLRQSAKVDDLEPDTTSFMEALAERIDAARASLSAPKPESAEAETLTPTMLADALGCFWNAAIGSAVTKHDPSADLTIRGMAEGIAAVEQRLREAAAPPRPEASESKTLSADVRCTICSKQLHIAPGIDRQLWADPCCAPVDASPQQASAPVGVEGSLAAWLRDLAGVCSELRPVGAWPGEKAAARLREAAAALDAVPVEAVPILKGIGKINGDGWKDTTKVGQVVYVWNTEMPAPHAPGQYPRVGNQCGWTASTSQYDFYPAAPEEVRDLFAALAQQPAPVAPDRIVLWSRGVEPNWYFVAQKSDRQPIDDMAVYETLDEIVRRGSPEAQQPAAVDEAMVGRFCRRWYEITGRSLERVHVLASLDSALAGQQQGGES